jgi:hypothetical protein
MGIRLSGVVYILSVVMTTFWAKYALGRQTIKYPDGIIKRIRYSRLPPNIEAYVLPVRNGVA